MSDDERVSEKDSFLWLLLSGGSGCQDIPAGSAGREMPDSERPGGRIKERGPLQVGSEDETVTGYDSQYRAHCGAIVLLCTYDLA